MAEILSEAVRRARLRLAKRRRERQNEYSSQDEGDYKVAPVTPIAQDGARYSPALLGDIRLNSGANTPVRTEVLHHAQKTHGNRAVQRFLQVQRSANTYTDDIKDDNLGKHIGSKYSEGEDLDAPVRSQLEEDLKANLSNVHIHTDAASDHMARSVQAAAFTSGRHIFFQAGSYDPRSTEGLKLLAHEAMHVVQQSKGPVDGKPTDAGITLSEPSDTFEVEAETAANRVAAKQDGSAFPGTEPVQRSEVEEPQPTTFSATTMYVQRG